MATDDIDGLTAGEALLITRRRLNESQEIFAKRFNLSRNSYGRIERDLETNDKVAIPEVSELTGKEKCLIIRKRKNLTQEECAKLSGVTRFWFNQIENGRVQNKDILEFWRVEDDDAG